MARNNPKVTFIFPYRWMTDDKAWFAENIRRKVMGIFGSDSEEERESLLAYRVIIFYQYKKPLEIPVTKTQIQIALKPIFPNARCLGVDNEYEQHRSKTMLPICDFRMYF